MARNKYPEVTVEKILEVSQKLFLQKGYEETTIQDIVDELGGLTKGAIYHHFKSKDDIMYALTENMFMKNNPFDSVRNRDDLNGLQKIQLAVRLNQTDSKQQDISIEALPILKNPRILAAMIESNREQLSPIWLEFINEGINDGSIKTQYAKELAELIPLFELWLMPSVYPASDEEIQHKMLFIKDMFNQMGLPIFSDDVSDKVKKQISRIKRK